MSWKKVHIADICEIKSGKRIPKGFDFSPITTDYRYIRARDIKKGKVDSSDLGYISKEVKDKIARYIVQEDDVVVSIAGTIGEVGYVPSELDGVNLTENAVRLTNFTEGVFSKFVLYWLMTEWSYEYMNGVAAGSAQPKLGIYKIEQIPISLPSFEIQHRIADILSAYDDLIENNRKQTKLLEEATQRLYKEWFVDLRFPGYEHAKITDGVPEGWHKALLGDIIDVKYGKDHKGIPDGTIPVYGSGGLMRKCDRALCDGESVLIPRKGSLNNIIYLDERFWTVDTMFYTELKKPNIGLFLYFSLKTLDMYSMNIGAAVPSMTTAILNTMEVVLPDDSLLGRFQRLTKNNFNAIKTLSVQSELASQARDRLLPKLMSGEVEV